MSVEELRASTLRKIDAEAEAVRSRYVTPGSGQALVYQAKQQEAEAMLNGLATEPPHIMAEAAARGLQPIDLARQIVAASSKWLRVSPRIEAIRTAAKGAVKTARTAAEIRAAGEVDWQSVED